MRILNKDISIVKHHYRTMSKAGTEILVILLGLCVFCKLINCTGDHRYIFVPEGQSFSFHVPKVGHSSVSWHYKAVSDDGKWKRLKEDSRIGFRTNAERTRFVLNIDDIHMRDAGFYGYAYEDGEEGYQELIVMENRLKCESNIDDKHSEDDKLKSEKDHRHLLEINCTIIYSGTKQPSLQWTLVKENSVFNGMSLQLHVSVSQIDSGRYSLLTSKIKLPAARLLDNSSVKCQLSQPDNVFESAAVSTILWVSDIQVVKCSDSQACYIDTRNADFIETDKAVYGITVVDKVIYVLQQDSAKIKLYDSHNLKYLHDISIPSLMRPNDMSGSVSNRSLYISDSENSCVHRVDLSRKTVERWTMKENHEPLGVSMTAEHTLLVSIKILGSGGVWGVVEYTSMGQRVREIRFDKSIKDVWQAVQLSSSKFAVAHGSGETSQHRVCVVNAEGKIEKAYGGKAGKGDEELYMPVSLTVDRNSEQIFVADTANSRIVVLDFNLIYQSQINSHLNSKMPLSIFFDSDTKRLLVGDSGGRVSVITT